MNAGESATLALYLRLRGAFVSGVQGVWLYGHSPDWRLRPKATQTTLGGCRAASMEVPKAW